MNKKEEKELALLFFSGLLAVVFVWFYIYLTLELHIEFSLLSRIIWLLAIPTISMCLASIMINKKNKL